MPDGREPDDFYAVLGLAPGAGLDDVRRAYHELAKRWHPDRAGADATFIFQRLSAAYEVLVDPVARAAYDRERAVATEPDQPARRAPGVLIRRLSSPIGALFARGIAEQAADGAIVLHLEPEEAAEGGMVTIAMPVEARCPSCPIDPIGPCARCGATRVVEELFAAWLAIRPGTIDGTMISPSVQLPGVLRPVAFRVRLAKH